MSETLSKPRLSLETDALIVCCACGYDLRGLGHDGVCPECGTEVQSSIHAAIEAEHAARTGALPLPSWLRIARSGYLAAAVTLLSAPWVLPPVREFFGLTVLLGRRAYFYEAMAMCCLSASIAGIVIGLLLVGHGSRWSLPVLLSVILLFLFAVPGLAK